MMAALWLAVGVCSASAAAVVKTIKVGSGPAGVSSDRTHVWVANSGGDTVSEIDASTGTVVRTITVGSGPWGVSSEGTHAWVANSVGDTVSEIDASTGTVVNTIPVGRRPIGVSSDGTHVWVANSVGDTVSEIDASTGTVVNTIPVGSGPYGVSSDGTHVWVANADDGTVSEIDASTGTVVKTIKVGGPGGVSSDGTHVWVANLSGVQDTASEIDASTGTVVKTIKVGGIPLGVSSDGTHVWVTNSFDDTVSEIDASTGKVVNTIPVGSRPGGVSSDGTHVWVANGGGNGNSGANTVSEIQISAGAAASRQISAYPEIPFPLSGVGNVWHGRPELKPSSWLMFADGSWALEKLKWTGWGTKVAHATGISSASNGIPDQAQGKRIKKKAYVTLWNPGQVLGHRVYRCFALSLPKQANNTTDCLRNQHGSWYYAFTKAEPPSTTHDTATTATSPASPWAIQPSTGPSEVTDPSLRAVSCVSASFCTAAGWNANDYEPSVSITALSDTWDGASWSAGMVATGQSLNDLSCTSATFCVAVGSTNPYGATRRSAAVSTWDGTSWMHTDLPALSGNSVLSSVACVSTTFCIAVGEHGKSKYPQSVWTQPLTEVWNGSAWSVVKAPSLGGRGGQLAAVTCLTARWCIVLGEYYKGHLGPYPDIPRDQWVAEIWNGEGWTVQHPEAINNQPRLGPDPWNFVTAVACTSPSSCIGTGYIPITQGDESPTPFAIRWNGHSWSPSRDGLPRFAQLNGVSCVAARSCFAVGEVYSSVGAPRSRVAPLVTRWNGSGWRRASTPRTPAQTNDPLQHGTLNGIACIPHEACMAVGSEPHGNGTTTLIESNQS